LADTGGLNLDDMIRRAMKALVTNEAAMRINLTGKQGKRRLLGLHLCQALFG